MHHQPVGADLSAGREEIIDGAGLHLRHHCIGLVGSRGLDGLQVMHRRRVHAGLHQRGHLPGLVEEALRPRAGRVVTVPIERGGQHHPLRRLQAKAMDVADEHVQARQLLFSRAANAEVPGGLQCVDGIAAGIGQADHLGARCLGLQQVGREVGGVDGMLRLPDDLPACRGQGVRRVFLQGCTQRIVDRQEVPAVVATL